MTITKRGQDTPRHVASNLLDLQISKNSSSTPSLQKDLKACKDRYLDYSD